MVYQPPFPPTEIEAIAIQNVGFMFADIFILVFFMLLMIYIYKKMDTNLDFLTIIVVYLFSIILGIESLTHLHTHFSPMLETFYILFQTSIFISYVLKTYNFKKNYLKKR